MQKAHDVFSVTEQSWQSALHFHLSV